MKNLNIVLGKLIFILCISCSPSLSMEDNNNIDLNHVSFTDISNYLESEKGFSPVKSIDIDISPILYKNDTVFYLVNYPRGWELLSADKRAPLSIMHADGSRRSINGLTTNPAEKDLLDCVAKAIYELRNNPDFIIDEPESSWHNREIQSLGEQWILISTDTLVVEPAVESDHLTQTRWGQGYPWHEKTPYISYNYYLSHTAYSSYPSIHCPAGCAPVACAQLLYFLHYKIGKPEKAYGKCDDTFIYSPGDSTIITASQLNLDPSRYSSSTWNYMTKSSTTATTGTMYASILMAQMGMIMETVYYVNKGSTTIAKKDSLLTSFSISYNSTTSFTFNTIRNQIINNATPLLVDLFLNTSGDLSNGHTALIDACRYHNYLINKHYVVVNLGTGSYDYRDVQSIDMEKSISFNWGYSGEDMFESGEVNWYNADIFPWIAGGNTFNYVYKLWYGFN